MDDVKEKSAGEHEHLAEYIFFLVSLDGCMLIANRYECVCSVGAMAGKTDNRGSS